MSVKVKATLGTDKYFTQVVAGQNTLITDEPEDMGGGNRGFNPYEILATSLASCTAATLRMYIDRKGWHIPEIHVEVELENFPKTQNTQLIRTIDFGDIPIEEEWKTKLSKIADACPVHKILNNPIEICTKFT